MERTITAITIKKEWFGVLASKINELIGKKMRIDGALKNGFVRVP